MVVGFERPTYTVGEGDGQVELCVNIAMPRRQDIGTITFNLTVETQDGSAGVKCLISVLGSLQACFIPSNMHLWLCCHTHTYYPHTPHVHMYTYIFAQT